MLLGKSYNEVFYGFADEELKLWVAYLEERPLGWREDFRTYLLLRSAGEKRGPSQIFPSLGPVLSQKRDPISSLKGSFLFTQMLNAKGGQKLDLEKMYEAAE